MIPMMYRKVPLTVVPMTPPTARKLSMFWLMNWAANPSAIAIKNTTEEWPREKKKPTPIGCCPCCSNFLVVLSMAAM